MKIGKISILTDQEKITLLQFCTDAEGKIDVYDLALELYSTYEIQDTESLREATIILRNLGVVDVVKDNVLEKLKQHIKDVEDDKNKKKDTEAKTRDIRLKDLEIDIKENLIKNRAEEEAKKEEDSRIQAQQSLVTANAQVSQVELQVNQQRVTLTVALMMIMPTFLVGFMSLLGVLINGKTRLSNSIQNFILNNEWTIIGISICCFVVIVVFIGILYYQSIKKVK